MDGIGPTELIIGGVVIIVILFIIFKRLRKVDIQIGRDGLRSQSVFTPENSQDDLRSQVPFTPENTPPFEFPATKPPWKVPNRVSPNKLRQFLISYFNEGELRDLCFAFGFDYDELPDVGKLNKAREIVVYFANRNRLGDLEAYCRQQRPDIPL